MVFMSIYCTIIAILYFILLLCATGVSDQRNKNEVYRTQLKGPHRSNSTNSTNA